MIYYVIKNVIFVYFIFMKKFIKFTLTLYYQYDFLAYFYINYT